MFVGRTVMACLGLTLSLGATGLSHSVLAGESGSAAVVAGSESAEKDAFENAKQLGTVEAWDAFLAHYANGFRADLARAYLKQIAAKPAASLPLEGAIERSCQDEGRIFSANSDTPARITFQNNSGAARTIHWIDFKGATKPYASLGHGDQITLDTFLTHPWLVTDASGNCAKLVLPNSASSIAIIEPGAVAQAPLHATVKITRPAPVKKRTSVVCTGRNVRIDGKCMLKADAIGYCGPGYRPQGGKCVPGYRAPKPSDGVPSWQKEAIRMGCPKGMAWNKFEGCHEND